MSEKLKTLQQSIKTKNDAVNAIFDKAGDGDLPKDKIEEVKTLNKEIEQIELEAKDLIESAELKSAADRRRQDLARVGGGLPFPTGDKDQRSPSGRFEEAKTLGERLLSDDEIKQWVAQIAPNGRVANNQRIQSPSVQVKSLLTGLSRTSAGALTQTDYKPLVNAAPFRPLTIRDLITIGETNSDLVEYPQITGYTDAAANVPEATSSAPPTQNQTTGALVNNAGGGYKPESAMALARVDAPVKTIATWIPTTNRALADAGQIRTLIDNFLEFAIERQLEDQMINGDGTGENFTGILNTGGIQSQAFATDILITTRKARTKLRTPGRVVPSAYVFNPLDWETIDLTKSSQGMYYFGGPQVMGNQRLWGVPVIESEAVPQGTGILADWKYAVVWDRMQAAITMSNSHADFFIRNLVAILAELRAAFGVQYTKAFCTIAFS